MNTKEELNQSLEFVEARIVLYKDLIETDCNIKQCYQNLLLTCTKAINEILIEIVTAKKYGTRTQIQTKKENLKWWQEQLIFEKRGVKWCNDSIKNYQIKLKFYEAEHKKIIDFAFKK